MPSNGHRFKILKETPLSRTIEPSLASKASTPVQYQDLFAVIQIPETETFVAVSNHICQRQRIVIETVKLHGTKVPGN